MSKFSGVNHSFRRRYVAKFKKGEFVSLIGNQRVRIFPPKSKNLFFLRISFIWYQKFQDWPSPLGGVTWSKYAECWPVRRKELIRIRIRTRYTSARQRMWSRTKKNYGNKVAGPSCDSPLTFKQHFFDVPTKSEVTRPSADCQTTVFRRIKQLEEFLKKVAERPRDSGRRSRDRRPTVK